MKKPEDNYFDKFIAIVILIAFVVFITIVFNNVRKSNLEKERSKNAEISTASPVIEEKEVVKRLNSLQGDLRKESERLSLLLKPTPKEKIAQGKSDVLRAENNLKSVEKTAVSKTLTILQKIDVLLQKMKEKGIDIPEVITQLKKEIESGIKNYTKVMILLETLDAYITSISAVLPANGAINPDFQNIQAEIQTQLQIISNEVEQIITSVTVATNALVAAEENLEILINAGNPEIVEAQVAVVENIQAEISVLQQTLSEIQSGNPISNPDVFDLGTQNTNVQITPYDPSKPKLLQGWTD